MIVDASALVAIVLGEADAEEYVEALATASAPPRLSAVNVVEAKIVVEARQGPEAARDLDLLLETAQIQVEPTTADQARMAVEAWRRFGRGRHPAALNLGDCFAYALARTYGQPLLYKGLDFSQTDIPAAR